MNCDDFKRLLHDFYTGDLDIELREGVERHGRDCPDCGALMRTAEELSCKELVEFLIDYVDGSLPADRREVFERHLAICPDCTAYLQSYRRTIEMSARSGRRDSADLPELPADLVEAILRSRQ